MPGSSEPVPVADLFSTQAATYADIRPDYPPELLEFVCGAVARRGVAWDCATGNGQAAVALAAYFDRVIATDASAEQLAHAHANPRIEYRVAAAEASGLPDGSIDLVTVAQALHWLDLDRFYGEVKRVLVRGGLLAVWSYEDPIVADDAAIDAALRHYNHVTVGPYWPPGRELVGRGYLRLAFPFDEIPAPPFVIVRKWTIHELAQYLRSWSARARYVARHGTDPVAPFIESLGSIWGDDPATRHEVIWPVTLRLGTSP
jgi:ubiquinone/menaquinone biosynthesis C-methylase UbiE